MAERRNRKGSGFKEKTGLDNTFWKKMGALTLLFSLVLLVPGLVIHVPLTKTTYAVTVASTHFNWSGILSVDFVLLASAISALGLIWNWRLLGGEYLYKLENILAGLIGAFFLVYGINIGPISYWAAFVSIFLEVGSAYFLGGLIAAQVVG